MTTGAARGAFTLDPARGRPLIFAARGCPFAHRVLALLDHLEVARDVRQAPYGQLPEGLTRWSPSGRIPLLVHGEIAIGDSRLMLEHLAEAYGLEAAYPNALGSRTLQRHAMALLDSVLVPRLSGDNGTGDAARLEECLDVFEDVMATALQPGLMSFHFAPLWLRFQWWQPEGAVTRALRRRPPVVAWLDRAAELPSVVRTSPDRSRNVSGYRAAGAVHGAKG